MPKIIILILFAGIFFASCKKDKDNQPANPANYSEIKQSHIQGSEAGMSTGTIVISDFSGLKMVAGDVYVFKTQAGLFGKLKVNSIDIAQNYQLSLTAEVYNTDGTTKAQANALIVRGTWSCDLDLLVETNTSSVRDFKNERINTSDTDFLPANGAKFKKYVF
jgi:hypothetical protein